MFVKKFEAETFEQALRLVKLELGAEALILSTQNKKPKWYGRGSFEITAASTESQPKAATKTEPKAVPSKESFDEEELKQIFPHRRETAMTFKKASINKYLDISDRTEDFSSAKAQEDNATGKKSSTKENPWESDFIRAGFSEDSARELSRELMDYPKREIEGAALKKTRARLIASRLNTLQPDIFTTKSDWVAIGGPGSGKTSLIVKLALFLRKRNRPVELISHDSRKIIGRAELAAYARLVGIAFHEESVRPEAHHIQLADSPSFSWRSHEECDEIAKLCRARSALLVIDATQRLAEICRTIDAARKCMPNAIALSRVDLVTDFGVIYEILKYAKLPFLVASVSRSFKIPVKFFEPLELAHFVSASLLGK